MITVRNLFLKWHKLCDTFVKLNLREPHQEGGQEILEITYGGEKTMKKRFLAGVGSGLLFLGVTWQAAYASPISSITDAALTGATILRFEDITVGKYESLTIDNVTISTIKYYEPDPTFIPTINVGQDVRQGKWEIVVRAA